MILAENNKYNSKKKLKILNFYSDWCLPCHAFMPNFIEAEKTFWRFFDFIAINSNTNLELFWKYRVMWTPTVIILKNNEIVFNQSWVPNWWDLKRIMMDIANIKEDDLEIKQEKRKKCFGLF